MNAMTSVNGLIAVTEQPQSASSEALSEMALSNDIDLLERIADDPRTTIETLIRLAAHPSAMVRMSVTENEHVPLSTLIVLANDECADVRFRVAENPQIDVCVLEMLVGDLNPYVSWRALSTLRRIKSDQSEALRCAA